MKIKNFSKIFFSIAILQNTYALGKKIPPKLPSETCFKLQKNEKWDSLVSQMYIPQSFCVKSARVEKVYTTQVAVRIDSNDIPQLLIGDIQVEFSNGIKHISLPISRYQLSKKDSDYYAFSEVDLLFNVDQNGQLISEFEVKGHINETPDIQKTEGEFADLIFEKTVRK